MKKKIVIVGGASSFTPGIFKSLLVNRKDLSLEEVYLQDIDEEKLNIMGQFCQIMAKKHAPSIKVNWGLERKDAFMNADFLLVQIRPGGLKQRELDEKIPLQFDLIGQETCGPGGFAFAMRTIPAMIEIAKDVVKYCPDAWVLNYSNPEAMISEALMRAVPEAKVMCLCDMPIGQELGLANLIGKEHHELTFDYYGLNHFGWFTKIYDKNGHDYAQDIIQGVKSGQLNDLKPEESARDEYWDDVFERIMKMIEFFPDAIPLTYLQYYLFPDDMLKTMDPNYSRANYVMDTRHKDVFEECKRVIRNNSIDDSELDTNAHGDYIVGVAISIANDLKNRYIVNVPNYGSISNFRDDVIVEVPCYVGANGPDAIAVGEIPDFQKSLMEIEKGYEVLAVEACLEGSYEKALKALTLNLTIPNANKAKLVLDALIEANQGYFPDFK
ncbi:6-phospho-alpha-glucosidase [Erysipelothrix urinaevulpis]|uniref:family 4 glycosyl hydrolase n=1 Tax=Erysipelothrix urinaevulpis TaxID=2683717 RepID=UPI00135A2D53|nr:6-phospho-alpha-glucosidase [Erysipelothrix urinaevulpis]